MNASCALVVVECDEIRQAQEMVFLSQVKKKMKKWVGMIRFFE
jgi:hypothetical protein